MNFHEKNFNKNSYEIRKMTIKDIPEVRDLWIKVGFVLTYSDKTKEIEKMIKYNPDLCLVGCFSDKLINSSVLGGFDGRRGWVHHLAVHPSLQGHGLGVLMMEELVDRFQIKGIAKLKLEILESNEKVIKFYQKLGWEVRSELTTMSITLRE